jgi:hypothetical protein
MVSFQDNWHWCNKCQGLAFGGSATRGTCPAGGTHDFNGSRNYRLANNSTFPFSSQNNWRWCKKCQGLSFAGNASQGSCPAGGAHDHSDSGNYDILQNVPTSVPYITQDNWRWCNKCQGMSFAGNATQGSCPAGGNHDHNGSGNYLMVLT